MFVDSVFPQLEALLPHVQKPIQYVGGELNSTVKPWDECDVRWALMYPDAYEVGLPNQGVMILYEVLNERPGVLAERTYSVWPDLEELMREHRVPQFTVDSHRPVKAFDVFGLSFSTEPRLHQHAHRTRPRGHPAGGQEPHDRRPDRPRGRPRRVQPRADRRVHRLRGHRRRRAGRPGDHRDHPRLEGRGPPRRPRGGALPPREDRRRLRPGLLRRRVPPGRPHRPRRTEQVGRAVAGLQAHRHGPRRVAVPEAAPRSPRRDRPRADVRRDLPRLHPRLPFLPGRR